MTREHEAKVTNMETAATRAKEAHEAAMSRIAENNKILVMTMTEEHRVALTKMTVAQILWRMLLKIYRSLLRYHPRTNTQIVVT